MTDSGSRGARPPGAAHWACGWRGSRVASPDEEVAADRAGARIGVDPRVGTETLDQLEAGPGSGDHADGDGVVGRDDRVVVQAEQAAVEAAIWGQAVASGLCASSWRAAIAAWSWYGPMGPRGRAAVTSVIPSSVALRSRRLRSCPALGMSDPPGPDFIQDITPGQQPWLFRVRCRRSPGPAVVSTAPAICQNIALRGCPRRYKSRPGPLTR